MIQEMNGLDFLKLLVTELSNQDPFEPMKNKEILEQLSAIRSLQANMTLQQNISEMADQQEATSNSLASLLSRQELASATALVGKLVAGADTEGQVVEGRVERVILDSSGVRVQIGTHEIPLENIERVGAEEDADAA